MGKVKARQASAAVSVNRAGWGHIGRGETEKGNMLCYCATRCFPKDKEEFRILVSALQSSQLPLITIFPSLWVQQSSTLFLKLVIFTG